MNWIYLDCFSGIAGDMFLAALLDAGLLEEAFRERLERIPLDGYELNISRQKRCGVEGVYFHVDVKKPGKERTLKDIAALLDGSGLVEETVTKAKDLFRSLARAEGRVHGIDPEEVHFHEVGAVDSIIDITGAVIALDMMNIDKIYCSSLPAGSGSVKTDHGRMPVPAPATAELLKNVPLREPELSGELVTPTGALIVSSLAGEFTAGPPGRYETVGYGLGTKDFDDRPNALRVFTGRDDFTNERVIVAEFNVDDCNPQDLGYLMDGLLERGVLDVFFTAVYMKKNRPGVQVTVICERSGYENISAFIFRESTTLGIRYREERRDVLRRETRELETPLGRTRVKLSFLMDETVNVVPEHDDCVRIAVEKKVPLKEVKRIVAESYKKRTVR